jgi:hypothetical protein
VLLPVVLLLLLLLLLLPLLLLLLLLPLVLQCSELRRLSSNWWLGDPSLASELARVCSKA